MIQKTRKDILLTVLNKLIWHRDLAEWFLLLLQQTDNLKLEEQLLESIIQALHTTKKQQETQQFDATLQVLQHIKQMEHREMDQSEAESLLSSLE